MAVGIAFVSEVEGIAISGGLGGMVPGGFGIV